MNFVDCIGDTSSADKMKNVIKKFFEVVKGLPECMRFVFITGVTRFAKTSIFSSMNNLYDITMSPRYAMMFGYDQKELESNFDGVLLHDESNGCANQFGSVF